MDKKKDENLNQLIGMWEKYNNPLAIEYVAHKVLEDSDHNENNTIDQLVLSSEKRNDSFVNVNEDDDGVLCSEPLSKINNNDNVILQNTDCHVFDMLYETSVFTRTPPSWYISSPYHIDDEYTEDIASICHELVTTGGSTQLIWKKGDGMWDKIFINVSNCFITKPEREMLKRCCKNIQETKKHAPFFLLRLYCKYFINYDIYCATYRYYFPDKEIDINQETFIKTKGKWATSNGGDIITNIYVIPFVQELIIV